MSSSPKQLLLMICTRKGAFIYHGNSDRQEWTLNGPHFLGSMIHHMVQDPRNQKTILMAARTGHLGPTIFRSTDLGNTWNEAKRPPAFKKAKEGEKGLTVNHTFWLTPGHKSEPGVWYAGTSPQGLFRSEDDGLTWTGVEGFNSNPMRDAWTGGGQDGTPDGPKMHSVIIDPRNLNHIYIGMSGGGVFESNDKGETWAPLNKGLAADFFPDPIPEYGHDPHCIVMHPMNPDRLYQQNHCGIYRIDRPDDTWIRIGDNMPKEVGDIGLPMAVHPRNENVAFVFPMDGTDVWPRTSPGDKPAVYRTSDAGKSWKRKDNGFPQKDGYLTVLRQCLTTDNENALGLYAGTTSGEIWASANEGEFWQQIISHLPKIYSVEIGYLS